MVKKGTFHVSQFGYTSGWMPRTTSFAAVRKQSTYDMEEDAPVQEAAGTQEDTPVQQAAAVQAGKLRACEHLLLEWHSFRKSLPVQGRAWTEMVQSKCRLLDMEACGCWFAVSALP